MATVLLIDNADLKIYKYGISGVVLNKNGSSPRANRQVTELFRTKKLRLTAVVLLTNIPGRAAAEIIESTFIYAYRAAFGDVPEGNPKHK